MTTMRLGKSFFSQLQDLGKAVGGKGRNFETSEDGGQGFGRKVY